MSKYSSVLKNVKDLLQKPFSYDNKVELKTKASNGTTFTTDASIGADGAAAANINVTGKHGAFGVDKLAVGTDKKIIGEFSLGAVAPGTDVNFKFTDGSRAAGAKTTASVGLVYTNDALGVATVDADALEGPNFDITLLKNYKGFLLGVQTKVNTTFLGGDKSKGAVSFGDCGGILGYTTPDYTLFTQCNKCGEAVDIGLTHNASSKLTAGFLATLACKDKKAPKVAFGGSYKLDDTTTVFGTADEAAKLSFAYKQKLNTFATLTVSTQIDAVNLASDNHKFGLQLNLTN
jgi:voltage-dependent anion channel protein 2